MLDKDLAAWDIPVTDDFLDGVRRGVRRRRLLRGATVGGGLLATAAVATLTVALTGSSGPPPDGTPPAAPTSAPASSAGAVLDGFQITRLPGGAVRIGPDSTYPAAVTEEGLHNDGPAPAIGAPKASVTMRRFDRGTGVGLFVTVLRPQPGTDPAVDAARIGDWLARWATRSGTPVKTFDVPAGTARLLAEAGSETTSHRVVITTPGHVVITIEGNAAFTVAELEAVAQGITG